MKNERNSIIILCIYVAIMLIVCALAVHALRKTFPKDAITDETTDTEISHVTEIVYIPIFSESVSDTTSQTQIESEPDKTEYTVKSYEGKIGIFTNSGTLVRVIDVYIKTLPKADRNLLEKGFVVADEAELRAIIEDYTG